MTARCASDGAVLGEVCQPGEPYEPGCMWGCELLISVWDDDAWLRNGAWLHERTVCPPGRDEGRMR